jgi:hypothetical protein
MLFAGFAALSLGIGTAAAQDSASGKPPPSPYTQPSMGGVQNMPGVQQGRRSTVPEMNSDATSGMDGGKAPAAAGSSAEGSGSGKK